MKKAVLLGDSIRLLGYGPLVPGMLKDEYQVWQSADNGRFAAYTLRMIFDEKDNIAGADAIHWNNGLWDIPVLYSDQEVFTPIDEYVHTMKRIAQLLLAVTPNVIFATTTPVLPENPYNHNRDIERYNAVISQELKAMGVTINDLHALVYPHVNDYISSKDFLHLTPLGARKAAEQVCHCIRQINKR
jgi:lysophospholipase L1-like esterase